jgi:cytochrome P450 family 110
VPAKNTLPPGPSNAVWQTLTYLRDPYGWLQQHHEKYGEIYTSQILNGSIVVANSPAGAQAIFTADPDTFGPYAVGTIEPIIGLNSVLLLTGVRHRRERRLLMPSFHGERMRAYGEIIRDTALNAASRWVPGQPMAFQDTSQAISLEVILRAVFGIQDQSKVQTTAKKVIGFVDGLSPALFFFRVLQHSFGGYGPWANFLRLKKEMHALLDEQIENSRREAHSGTDILSMMLGARHEDGSSMTMDELRDELVTLVFAGHETTGVALAWAIYWLLTNPECMQRLLGEIDALGPNPDPEAFSRLPYLEAVIHETLRLHPIVPDVPRTVLRPFNLLGYDLPVGMGVGVATARLHMNPDIYPEPERFKPERFLARKFSPFEFTPFGGGSRRCLGAAFATYEMKIVLGTLLAHHRLVLAEPGELKPIRRNLVMGPATGVRVKYIGPRSPRTTSIAHAA